MKLQDLVTSTLAAATVQSNGLPISLELHSKLKCITTAITVNSTLPVTPTPTFKSLDYRFFATTATGQVPPSNDEGADETLCSRKTKLNFIIFLSSTPPTLL